MATRIKEEHEFEIVQLKKGISSQLAGMIRDLQLLQKRIDTDPTLSEGYMPQNGFIGLAVRYGKLCEMQRLSYAFQEVA